jgi:hypothetical protein
MRTKVRTLHKKHLAANIKKVIENKSKCTKRNYRKGNDNFLPNREKLAWGLY